MDFTGRSQFEIKVLKAVQKIPYGKTRSYGYLAKSIGQAGAGRAVGQALARNAWPVLIPCHRVIRRDGSLGGFSGGLKWKKQLIMLEKK